MFHGYYYVAQVLLGLFIIAYAVYELVTRRFREKYYLSLVLLLAGVFVVLGAVINK